MKQKRDQPSTSSHSSLSARTNHCSVYTSGILAALGTLDRWNDTTFVSVTGLFYQQKAFNFSHIVECLRIFFCFN